MKNRFTILALLLSLCWSYAHGNEPWESNKSGSESTSTEKEGSDNAGVSNSGETGTVVSDEEFHSEEDWKVHDPDSSQYSVNKFNYLFYFLYRVKYGSEADLDAALEGEKTD